MKKIINALFIGMTVLTVGFALLATNAYGAVIVDGEKVDCETKFIGGMTYTPLEPMVKVIGANVEFKGDSVYLVRNENTFKEMEIKVGSKEYKLKDMTKVAPGEPTVQEDKVMIPLTTLVELLGGEVHRQSDNIIVTSYEPIKFTDEMFEKSVRAIVKKSTGDIFKCDVDYITALSFSGKNIKNIEGIQYFKNLSYVDFSGNEIKDVSPLRDLNGLITVFLKDNGITDFSPLLRCYPQICQRDFSIDIDFKDPVLKDIVMNKASALKTGEEVTLKDIMKITELDLSSKGINDLQGIQSLVNLKKLNLTDNNVENIEPLGNLVQLEELILPSNKIENVDSLVRLNKLKTLDLYNNKVSKIEAITKLTSLNQLGLYENNIADITGIGDLINLKFLVLSNNNITKIDELSKLINLKELYILGGNAIVDFTPLDNLRESGINIDAPKEVVFRDQNIEKIVRKAINKATGTISVSDLYSITKLSLNSKSISDLGGIQYITDLEELDLSDNFLSDISLIKKLGKLKSLNLSINEIKDISSLANLKHLEDLNISHNSISSIAALRDLNNLKSLRLSNNKIDSYYPVEGYYDNLKDNKDFECGFIEVMLDGNHIRFDSAPQEENGRVIVQAVPMLKALNMSYEYNSELMTLTANSTDLKIAFKLDSSEVVVNGVAKRMKTEAKSIGGRMYIPVTFVSECIIADVKWDPSTKIVNISSK